jgi:dTDP-4-amino-4,6-dideoxygalactose transaminase
MISFHEPELPPGVQEAVKAVLESGWVNTGPKVRELEEAIAKRLNVSPILCLNSGTAAMEIALSLLKLETGEEVILPAWSYVSAAHAIIHQGGIPVFADIQEDFTLDLKSVAEKINSKTRAVIGVDIAGLPCDYAELKNLLHTRNPEIKLIADAAHSFGAEINGESAAIFADFTAYSFHLLKNFTTIEGGALALTSGSKSEKDCLKTNSLDKFIKLKAI